MKYLRNFDTLSDYNLERNELEAPNISLIEEDNRCRYINYCPKTKIGDIVLFDELENKYLFISPEAYTESYWQDLRKVPIGVVAVETKYTPDNSTRVVSLLNMSLKNPELGTGVASPLENDNYMYWGGNGVDIPGLHNWTQTRKVNPLTGESTGYNNWVRLPSDQQFNSTGYVDPLSGCRYYFNNYINDPNSTAESKEDRFGPYPVLKNGDLNPLYYDPDSATSDFDGPTNTDLIVGAAEGTYTNWKTEPLVNNYEHGNYPPAFCCRRYRTPGTKSGDWYLPAIGEAMFLSTHYKAINKGLLAVSEKRGLSTAIRLGRDTNFGSWCWSSSEVSSSLARNVYLYGGRVDYTYKSYLHVSCRVRAFLRFF